MEAEISQSPSDVVMIRPLKFGYDTESAASNAFQKVPEGLEADAIAERATKEFDAAVEALRLHGINVKVFTEDINFNTPDAVFPNNWFGTFPTGEVVLYPMMPKNRRMERRQDVIDHLKASYKVTRVIDLTGYEEREMYLEGTGSVVFDYPNRKAYACRSPRTNQVVLEELCRQVQYEPVVFDSLDRNGVPVYHTNVMMWIGEEIAAVCLESIPDKEDRKSVEQSLKDGGKVVLALSQDEMDHFCGNALEVTSATEKERFLAISTTADKRLAAKSKDAIDSFMQRVVVDLPIIESAGGGCIRCMLGDVHLPKCA